MTDISLVRVFIGSSRSEWLPAKVLEHSIKSRSNSAIDVVRLYETKIQIPIPKRKDCAPRTPFSFQRFLIPELCNFHGKAIYLDADMLVFSDITELWNTDMEGSAVLSVAPTNNSQKPQFSVILLDTEKLKWNIQDIVNGLDEEEFTYSQLMYEFSIAEKVTLKIPYSWNTLEYFNQDTKLLHYTDMTQQPWVSLKNPLSYLWLNALKEAVLNGEITMENIDAEIQLGHVRPSLKREINSLLNDSGTVGLSELAMLDINFIPPFRSLQGSLVKRIKDQIKGVFSAS